MGDAEGAPTFRIFLSWCSTDEALKSTLVPKLEVCLRNLAGIRFEWWEMSHLRCGEEFKPEILASLDECDAGLQLVTQGFLASAFIREHETPVFIGPRASRKALPVMLKHVRLGDKAWDLQGIDRHEVHHLDGKSYAEIRAHRRDLFEMTLAEKIQDRLLDKPRWQAL